MAGSRKNLILEGLLRESTLKRRKLATRMSHLLASDPAHPWPLMETAHRLLQLERRVAGALEPELRRHCRVAGLRGDELMLLASSPAWATRLRYAAPALIERLRDSGVVPRIRNIQVRVQMESGPQPGPRHPPARLSRASGELIEATALGLGPGTLREALLRLARRAKEKP